MANPYLACAVTLAAGLDGIKRGLRLPAETELTDAGLSDLELRELGCSPLPRNLQEALDIFENSLLMKDALGEHIHSFFLKKKRKEWEKYASSITEWELKQYLASS